MISEHARFLATLFAFMGSMLGVVLADNIFALFVFWELTGFTSFLLIGFDQERPESRSAAIQAFVVTSTGGMALLAAAVLIELAAGSHDLSALLSSGAPVRESAAYPWIAALVLLAAFTKSAQTPFHFWLPNAMAAPTPVSAYLHSATMVKAGLYLVARMTPLMGGTVLWTGADSSGWCDHDDGGRVARSCGNGSEAGAGILHRQRTRPADDAVRTR